MKRWGALRATRLDEKELSTDLGRGNFLFVGSSCDMFAASIPRAWTQRTLEHCASFPNKYLFQSKNPLGMASFRENLRRLGAIVCTTIETNRVYPDFMGNTPSPRDRAEGMAWLQGLPRFVTIEPVVDFDLEEFTELLKRCEPAQVNIGADSGHNGLPEPSKTKILDLIDRLSTFTVIDQKRNLSRVLQVPVSTTK